MEEFIDVKGYEGLYQVSNLGNVISVNHNRTGKQVMMKLHRNKQKYIIVKLSKNSKYKTFQVHQLVAMSFLNHEYCGHELVVNHKDFNRSNNHVDNLEVITQRENTNKKHIPHSSKYTGVSWHKKMQKWQSRIWINNTDKHLGFFDDEKEAAEFYNNAVISFSNNQEIIVKERNYKSKLKGVGWHSKNKKWTSQIRVNGKMIYLGSFDNEIDAHNAYQKKLASLNNI